MTTENLTVNNLQNQEHLSTQSAEAEKMLPQSAVNDLVGSAKQKGFDKGYQQAKSENQPQSPQLSQNSSSAPPEDQIRKVAADEFSKQAKAMQDQQFKEFQEREGQRIWGELQAKFQDAKTDHPDFDQVVKQDDLQQIPDVLLLANKMDNAGHVVRDLMQNPGKIASLRMLPPNLAEKEIRKLSDSIKQNKSAAAAPATPAPLSNIKSSNLSIGDGKPKTAADYRKLYAGKT